MLVPLQMEDIQKESEGVINLKGSLRSSDAQRYSSPRTGLLVSVCETPHLLLKESPDLVCVQSAGEERRMTFYGQSIIPVCKYRWSYSLLYTLLAVMP